MPSSTLGSFMEEPRADSLSTLKSTFGFTRRTRNTRPATANSELTPTFSEYKVQHAPSRAGFRGMFSRGKLEQQSLSAVSPVDEDFPSRTTSIDRLHSIATGYGPQATNMSTGRPSRLLSLRSRQNKISDVTPAIPSKSKPAPKVTANSTPPRRTSTAWDPPPLFQAYPQALKHIQLASPTLSADTIIRNSNHKRSGSIIEDLAMLGIGTGETSSKVAVPKENDKTRSKHHRQISLSAGAKMDWTQKIYVLMTSGYLLQYSGDGSFDRLPEKMMQLGKDSVAFASDVFPGKHWVLQISQAMDAEGTPAQDSRSVFSRLTFRGADYRRSATSFLLVFNSAEELVSWLTIVRREIEALGGKKYLSEPEKSKVDQLKQYLNEQSLVQEDLNKFSNPPTPRTLAFNPPWNRSAEVDPTEGSEADILHRNVARASVDAASLSTSLTSHDGRQLDSLRDSSHRLSYMSSGQRTIITSRGSSPSATPTKDSFGDLTKPAVVVEGARLRPNGIAISERRRSVQTLRNPILDYMYLPTTQTSRPRPHSTYNPPAKSIHPFPSTQNFSVPNSVSKRYTLSKISDIPLSSSLSKPFSKKLENAMKGNRKSPPAPLHTRPLSTVEDHPSPVKTPKTPHAHTPTESTLRHAVQKKSSTIEISARSPSCRSISAEISRRHSSMNLAARDAPEMPKVSATTTPLFPHMIPLPPSPGISATFPTKTVARLTTLVSPRHEGLGTPSTSATPVACIPQRLSSIQMRSPASPVTSKFSTAKTPSKSHFSIPKFNTSPSLPAPSSCRLSQRSHKVNEGKCLVRGRSMPLLLKGPPSAPPPQCALPPLPPVGARSPPSLC